MFRHILVPTDGSAGADIAIASSMRFARSIGARVTGLHSARRQIPVLVVR
jgi:nucleotide-binding universal stress UspA family protein